MLRRAKGCIEAPFLSILEFKPFPKHFLSMKVRRSALRRGPRSLPLRTLHTGGQSLADPLDELWCRLLQEDMGGRGAPTLTWPPVLGFRRAPPPVPPRRSALLPPGRGGGHHDGGQGGPAPQRLCGSEVIQQEAGLLLQLCPPPPPHAPQGAGPGAAPPGVSPGWGDGAGPAR